MIILTRKRLLVAAWIAGLVALHPSSAAAQSETVEYYGTDAVGSIRIVFDATGALKGRLDTGPFGEPLTSADGVGQKVFAQIAFDGESALGYAEARMYQSRTGRFNAPDAVYARAFDSQQWNRYSYALNNPLKFIDPTGLNADSCSSTITTSEDGVIHSQVTCQNAGGGAGGGGGVSAFVLWVLDNFFLGSVPVNGAESEIVPTERAGYRPSAATEMLVTATVVAVVAAPVVARVVGGQVAAKAESSVVTKLAQNTGKEAFHYTFDRFAASIVDNGLRPGSYATLEGTLSPLQAQIELALPPNRGLPDAVLRIDLEGMRSYGYNIPSATPVSGRFGLPGGGTEIFFPYTIPGRFISVVRP